MEIAFTTPADFRRVVNTKLLPHFPDLSNYVRGVPAETKEAWCSLFEAIEICDLVSACEAIVRGDEIIAAYERERMATILLRIARGIRDVRLDKIRQQRRNEKLREQARHSADVMEESMDRIGCGEAYREILRRWDAGEDRDAVKRDVLARLS